MRAEATVRFLGKTTLVLKFEGKELACGAGKEVENAREAKVSINEKQQDPPVIPSSNSSPLSSNILYTRYCWRSLYM